MLKKRNFLCLFILFMMISISSTPDLAIDKPAGNDAQVLITSWVAMWNSYDLTMVDKLFLQDSRVSYFSSEKEGLIQGITAVREHHVEFGFIEGGKSQENKLWVEDVHTSDFGKAAVVAGIWYFQRGLDNPENVQKGPFTFVCLQQG